MVPAFSLLSLTRSLSRLNVRSAMIRGLGLLIVLAFGVSFKLVPSWFAGTWEAVVFPYDEQQ
jgi:hypothetical protein